MKVLVPADSNQTRAAVLASLSMEGPVYIRFGRNPVPQVYPAEKKVIPGSGNLLLQGDDITLVACGAMVACALEASRLLEKEGVRASVLDMVSVKPLDSELILERAGATGRVLVAQVASMEPYRSCCPGKCPFTWILWLLMTVSVPAGIRSVSGRSTGSLPGI
jgi:transketolase